MQVLQKQDVTSLSARELFQFVSQERKRRGWGRSFRRAVSEWYTLKDPDELLDEARRCPAFEGWTHADLMRLSHPKPPTPAHQLVFAQISQEARRK